MHFWPNPAHRAERKIERLRAALSARAQALSLHIERLSAELAHTQQVLAALPPAEAQALAALSHELELSPDVINWSAKP